MDSFCTGRRALLAGVASATLALLGRPRPARAVPAESATLTLPGGQRLGATLYLPPNLPAPATIVVHDRWGLSAALRERAAALALDRYLVLAIDLFGGRSATGAAEAERLARGLDPALAEQAVTAWVDWLASDARCTGKVGTLAMGSGGTPSLAAAMRGRIAASIVYYTALPGLGRLGQLRGPVLGHYSRRDAAFDVAAATAAQAELRQADRRSRLHLYDADGDFANPASRDFARGEALLAWNRSVAFLRQTLGAGD